MTLSISACATPVSPDVTPAACTAYWENSQGFLAGEVDNTPRAVKERLIVLHEAMVAACGEYQE